VERYECPRETPPDPKEAATLLQPVIFYCPQCLRPKATTIAMVVSRGGGAKGTQARIVFDALASSFGWRLLSMIFKISGRIWPLLEMANATTAVHCRPAALGENDLARGAFELIDVFFVYIQRCHDAFVPALESWFPRLYEILQHRLTQEFRQFREIAAPIVVGNCR
jgi:hypothetical protein